MRITEFKERKSTAQKISMVTCYDYPSACIVAESNIDCILVGDSLAMAVHGFETTLMATMEMMVLHTAAVARGIKKQFLVADLPFLCHRLSQADTMSNVRRILQVGAQAIKIEGGDADVCQTISTLVTAGVPIMGHIGLIPQSVNQLGGYKVQGKSPSDAAILLQQAQDLESAGCFALVIECVPKILAKEITQAITIPTIGIGAGAETDGQVLVWHDLLALQTNFKPRFVKAFASGKKTLLKGLNAYVKEVQKGTFPASEHEF